MTQADKLLLLIEERSENGLYFVPSSDRMGMYLHRLGEWVTVAGSGDAASLKSFHRKGWIEWEPKLGKYACRITEDGKLRAQTIA